MKHGAPEKLVEFFFKSRNSGNSRKTGIPDTRRRIKIGQRVAMRWQLVAMAEALSGIVKNKFGNLFPRRVVRLCNAL